RRAVDGVRQAALRHPRLAGVHPVDRVRRPSDRRDVALPPRSRRPWDAHPGAVGRSARGPLRLDLVRETETALAQGERDRTDDLRALLEHPPLDAHRGRGWYRRAREAF